MRAKYINSRNSSRAIINPIKKLFYKNPEHGAQTSVMLAVEPELEKVTGKYFVDCKEGELSNKAKDDDTAQWLWKKSQEMTGLEVSTN